MTKPMSADSLAKAIEMFKTPAPVPEGKEWRLVYVNHPRYVANIKRHMDAGLSQVEAMMIVPSMFGWTQMMLMDKEES